MKGRPLPARTVRNPRQGFDPQAVLETARIEKASPRKDAEGRRRQGCFGFTQWPSHPVAADQGQERTEAAKTKSGFQRRRSEPDSSGQRHSTHLWRDEAPCFNLRRSFPQPCKRTKAHGSRGLARLWSARNGLPAAARPKSRAERPSIGLLRAPMVGHRDARRPAPIAGRICQRYRDILHVPLRSRVCVATKVPAADPSIKIDRGGCLKRTARGDAGMEK